MSHYCKGCVLIKLSEGCELQKYNLGETNGASGNEIGKCPCTECLVKSMCKDGCNEYFKWNKRCKPDLT